MLKKLLFILYFLGIYINVYLPLGSIQVPFFLSHLAGICLIIIHIVNLSSKKYFYFLISIISFLVCSLFLSPKLYSNVFISQFTTTINFIVSIISFMGVYFTYKNLDDKFLLKFSFYGLLIIIFGCISEVLFPFIKNISDTFRNTIYTFDVYDNYNRDFGLVFLKDLNFLHVSHHLFLECLLCFI